MPVYSKEVLCKSSVLTGTTAELLSSILPKYSQ